MTATQTTEDRRYWRTAASHPHKYPPQAAASSVANITPIRAPRSTKIQVIVQRVAQGAAWTLTTAAGMVGGWLFIVVMTGGYDAFAR